MSNDSRKEFFESWIQETPQRSPARNDFNVLLNSLLDFQKVLPAKHVRNNIYYIEGDQVVFFYALGNNEIAAILELEKRPETLTVLSVAKKDTYQFRAPWVSDLYIAAADTFRSLKFTSDATLTDEGFNLWKRLLKTHTILVYDITHPGLSLVKIENEEELKKYFGDAHNLKNYRYVLTESTKWFSNVKETFTIRRTREVAGITLDEDYK